jgi:hypothetical protein
LARGSLKSISEVFGVDAAVLLGSMDKHTVITLKNKGKSNREVARLTGT